MITKDIAEKAIFQTKGNGGYTVDLPHDRFIWSTFDHNAKLGSVDDMLIRLAGKLERILDRLPDGTLWGLWVNKDGYIEFDVNESSDDLTIAVKEAIHNRQAAIWDSELQVDHTVLSALSLLVAAHADKAITLAGLLDDSR